MPSFGVDEFMQNLDHGRKDEVQSLRELILSATSELSEQIKWNAPSFGIDGDDRITFRLQPDDRVQLIFHRGVKKRSDSDQFVFEDASGMMDWVAKDRAVVTFTGMADVAAKSAPFQELVKRWIEATTRPDN